MKLAGGLGAPRRRLLAALPLAGVLVLFCARFQGFLRGGVIYTRDAGFFFVPWREAVARQLRAGQLPLWNDALASGRALAADPNAAVFWPLGPLALLVGPTGLMLANALACLLLFFAALRLWGLRPASAAAGTVVLLASGVFQSLPIYFTTLAAAAPLPLAVVALAGRDETVGPPRRRLALAAAAFGLSVLGGEPFVTVVGAAAALAVACWRVLSSRSRAAARDLSLTLAALLLAVGASAIQVIPAVGELSRSTRALEKNPGAGALFWSVRPGRLLTLFEPRLVGDPHSGEPRDFWGAGTFDAGNAYFDDLSVGLLPLAFAALAWRGAKGRAALLLAALGALLSMGRYVPLWRDVAAAVGILRYPEKWWLLSTFALAAAAAAAVEELLAARGTEQATLLRRLERTGFALAVPLGLGWALATLTPDLLREALWGLGLGAGSGSASYVAASLVPHFLFGAGSAVLMALFAREVVRGKASIARAALVVGAVFFLDAGRRTAGSCIPGAPDLYARTTPLVKAVLSEMPRGRFYDDGADDPAVAARRTKESDGLDPLHPATGLLHGVRYAADNDIDRLMPAESMAFSRRTAQLPWGAAKVARLRVANVAVVRTQAPPPDPPGVTEMARSGKDRIVRIEETRPELAVFSEVQTVPNAAAAGFFLEQSGHAPLITALVERPGPQIVKSRLGLGRVRVLSRTPSRLLLATEISRPGALLAVAQTFDPSWRATIDGRVYPLERIEGFLTGLFVPYGRRTVELRYVNHGFRTGAVVSAFSASLIVALLLWRRRGT